MDATATLTTTATATATATATLTATAPLAPAADPVRRDLLDPGTDLLVLPARQAWMADAACQGRGTLFFGIAGERPERRIRREARARQVCAGCPVLDECRTMARLNGENGFWGGESEEERAAAGYPPVSISRRSVQRAAASATEHREAC
jgi:WhiB family redox-sensing transcriptional regulator